MFLVNKESWLGEIVVRMDWNWLENKSIWLSLHFIIIIISYIAFHNSFSFSLYNSLSSWNSSCEEDEGEKSRSGIECFIVVSGGEEGIYCMWKWL